MEKKGDILNQLAIIADLLEKANFESHGINVNINLNEKNFNVIIEKISTVAKGMSNANIDKTFSLKIGEINFIFNKNNA